MPGCTALQSTSWNTEKSSPRNLSQFNVRLSLFRATHLGNVCPPEQERCVMKVGTQRKTATSQWPSIRPRGFEPLTFGSGAVISDGRSCLFNRIACSCLLVFADVCDRLPPILPPGFAPEFLRSIQRLFSSPRRLFFTAHRRLIASERALRPAAVKPPVGFVRYG